METHAHSNGPFLAWCTLLALMLSCCATRVVPAMTPLRVGSERLELPGIGACGADDQEVAIDPRRPLAVLVHGSNATGRDFATLAQLLALHGRQAVCYRYPHRDSLANSAARLRSALLRIAELVDRPDVLVLGHSQGGLVARVALTARADHTLAGGHYRLVTVASPFGGVRAARDCGSVWMHLASFGMSAAMCRAITGAKWNEIHARSALVRAPHALSPAVREHLTIVTDERDTCRRYSLDGLRCLQDDYVFSVAEQHNARIEEDERVVQRAIRVGHAEVVGARGTPEALIEVLEQSGQIGPVHGEPASARPSELTANSGL